VKKFEYYISVHKPHAEAHVELGEQAKKVRDATAEELTSELIGLLLEYPRVFYSKQVDYGPENISKFGELGVVVRMYDKVQRLANLIFKSREPSNESIDDTLFDIIGYAAIMLLIRRGSWPGVTNDQ